MGMQVTGGSVPSLQKGLVSPRLLQDGASKAAAQQAARRPWGSLHQAPFHRSQSTSPDNMTLPRYQPRTDYLAPLGKILAFTRGCKQRSSAATSFPTFQSLEGEMLVSFYALKALQLKEDLTIF